MKEKPIVIDLFAGAGGESQGIHWAMGDNIKLFAVNHWQRACETHSVNFPMDECICQDITTVIPTSLVPNRKAALLWASPECTYHSVARGGKPCDDQSRCTPWDIIRWVSMVDFDRIIVENVPEFLAWGRLGEDNKPIAEERGLYFNAWFEAITKLGYKGDWRILNAADYGAPTTRSRLFVQFSRKNIVWPTASHCETPDLLNSAKKRWIPAKDIIDWNEPCMPIEARKNPLCPNTMKRIMQGIEKFWGEGAIPFIARYNGGANRVHSVDDPIPTLDTSNRYALVKPLIVKFNHGQTVESIDQPMSTIACSGAHHGLIEPLIIPYYGNSKASKVSNPLPTVTTKDRFGLATTNGVSIGFRMLKPSELAAAQSFPSSYEFTGTKADVVKQIGNAVCPKVAAALVGA
jgi:DNA-methyltransferase (dcm)